MLKKPFSRRWWWATLLVILGMAFLVRLGFWQLDRFNQRRDFNATVVNRWKQEPFDVSQDGLPAQLDELEYRRVRATGQFDYANQIVLKNQNRDGAPGVFLVTPLVQDDGWAVLVARGWVPYNQSTPEFWPQFEEAEGAPVVGMLQESQLLPSGEAPEIPATPQVEWFRVNVDAIQPQMPYALLPVFILQMPEEGRPYETLPFREEPTDLIRDPGTHMSYAAQWFAFALILGGGYIILIHHHEQRLQRLLAEEESAADAEDVALAMPHQEGHA